jgi:hypothetical protein
MRSSFFSTYPLREEVTSTWWPVTFSCMEASFDSTLTGTFLRSLDGGMPSASRYLATVRRATSTPSRDRISAMRLSDSGLSGSSADTSLRILARIAVDDISVPSLAATWLEKK